MIDAGGKAEEKGDIEHHNMPATSTPNDPEAVIPRLARFRTIQVCPQDPPSAGVVCLGCGDCAELRGC